MKENYYIGWDVGALYCDDNDNDYENEKTNSKDAIVILDSNKKILGKTWRENLRKIISDSNDCSTLVEKLFKKCDLEISKKEIKVIMAIDAPLGFSKEFRELLNGNFGPNIRSHLKYTYLISTYENFACTQSA